MFQNKATKMYERLDSILKKDKNIPTNNYIKDNIVNEFEKILSIYYDTDKTSAKIKIDEKNSDIFLSYSVKLKRMKNFIITESSN